MCANAAACLRFWTSFPMSFLSRSQNKFKICNNLKVIFYFWCSIICANAAACLSFWTSFPMSFFSRSHNKFKTCNNLKVIFLFWCSIICADAADWQPVEVFSPFFLCHFSPGVRINSKFAIISKLFLQFGSLWSVLMLLPGNL